MVDYGYIERWSHGQNVGLNLKTVFNFKKSFIFLSDWLQTRATDAV